MSNFASIVMISGPDASEGSVDAKIRLSETRLKTGELDDAKEYVLGPQREDPSLFPYVELAKSVARIV